MHVMIYRRRKSAKNAHSFYEKMENVTFKNVVCELFGNGLGIILGPKDPPLD